MSRGLLAFKTNAKKPHVESRELRFANLGGGTLPKLSVSVADLFGLADLKPLQADLPTHTNSL